VHGSSNNVLELIIAKNNKQTGALFYKVLNRTTHENPFKGCVYYCDMLSIIIVSLQNYFLAARVAHIFYLFGRVLKFLSAVLLISLQSKPEHNGRNVSAFTQSATPARVLVPRDGRAAHVNIKSCRVRDIASAIKLHFLPLKNFLKLWSLKNAKISPTEKIITELLMMINTNKI
jgi:hypothetical protein